MVAVLLVTVAGQFLRPINAQREEMGMTTSLDGMADLPPEIAFTTVALGGFRGLAVDYFWIRMELLRQEGRIYEANQLANWICKLQPHFVRVWSFQGWNLAYNISVMTRTFKERWNWVHNGITLLRDEGIKYNPKAISLYRELGWIFFHKMGMYMDDFHLAYKRQWAWDIERVLGNPPADMQAEGIQMQVQQILDAARQPDRRIAEPLRRAMASEEQVKDYREQSTKAVIDWFAAIANAPASWQGLVADEKMAAFVEACQKAGIKVRVLQVAGGSMINPDFFDEYQEVLSPTLQQQFDLRIGKLTLAPDAQALQGFLTDEKTRPLAERLVAFLRRHALVEQFKMDPEWMLHLMERFGPIEWRLPDPHGMYWTSYGVKVVEELGLTNVEEFFGPNTSLNTDRLMLFALQRLTFYGRLFFEPDIGQIELSYIDILPDLRFVARTHETYLEVAGKYDPTVTDIAGRDFRDGHQNYLRDAIRYFYMYGERDLAEYYYEYLRRNYRLYNGQYNDAYLQPLGDFVRNEEFTERFSDPRIANGAITTMLDRAMRYLAMGEADKAEGMMTFARDDLYKWYVQYHAESPSERMKLPPFEAIFNDVAIARLVSPDDLIIKHRLWQVLPVRTQVAIYDNVIQVLTAHATAMDRAEDLGTLFPPPPGLEQHRQRRQDREKGQQQGDRGQAAQSVEQLKQESRGQDLQMQQ